jgi:catalase
MLPPQKGTSARWVLLILPAIVLAVFFVYLAGLLTPDKPTAHSYIKALVADSGHHPGYRRNHAKGICVSGYFQGSGQAQSLSMAPMFANVKTPVMGRFSLSGGNPATSDLNQPVRAMALQLNAKDGQQWRMAMINSPVFLMSTPTAFLHLLQDKAPDPTTGKPDGVKIKAFFTKHPEAGPFLNSCKM